MTPAAYFRSALTVSLVSPLGLFLLAFALVLALPEKRLCRRRAVLAVLLALFALSCTDLFGRELLSLVESFAPSSPTADKSRPVVVLVLGGGAVAEGELYQPSVSSQRRLRRAQEVLSFFPRGTLLISGIEAPLLARWPGLRACEPMLEARSLNTRENFRECGKLLRKLFPDAKDRPQVAVVTDRFHMARAMCWAGVSLDGFDVVPMPAASLVRRSCSPSALLPSRRGLEMTSMAWRELLALARDTVRARYAVKAAR